MIGGALQRSDPGVEAALPLAEFNDPRTPANGAIAAESCLLSVRQGDPFMNPDVVVVMVVPHKHTHHVLHLYKGGQHAGVDLRTALLFLFYAHGLLFSGNFFVFGQWDMEKCQGGIGGSAVQDRHFEALFPVPGNLVEFDPAIGADFLITPVTVGVEEVEQGGCTAGGGRGNSRGCFAGSY